MKLIVDVTDDEAGLEVLLDALLHHRENVIPTYDPEDRQKYIDALNRIAEALGVEEPRNPFYCDGHATV